MTLSLVLTPHGALSLRRDGEPATPEPAHAAANGLSFGEAMRLLAGAGISGDATAAAADIDWSQTVAGPWLAQTLEELRHHRPGQAVTLEGNLPRLRRDDRFPGGTAAGSPGQRRHGPGLPRRRWPVSGAGRDQACMQLPGLGGHVQARGGSALRGRGPARPDAAAVVLRGVDENELLAGAGQDVSLSKSVGPKAKVLDDTDMAALFGLEMAEDADAGAAVIEVPTPPRSPRKGKRSRATTRLKAAKVGKPPRRKPAAAASGRASKRASR